MSSYTPTGTSTINGADCYASGNTLNYHTETFWRNTVFGTTDYDTNWYWDRTANLPKLRVFLKPPSIATPTGSATVQSGQPNSLSTTLTNPSGLSVTYQWQSSPDQSTWTDEGQSQTTSATSTTLTYQGTKTISSIEETVYWRVVWTSDYSSTQSATADFITVVYNLPTQPTTLTILPTGVQPSGTTITFSVGGNTYTSQYEWYIRTAGTAEAGTLISTTSTALTSIVFQNTGSYEIGVITKNAFGTAQAKWFDSQDILIYNVPTITNPTASPTTAMYKTPTSITLSASVTDSGSGVQPTTYQWYQKAPSELSFSAMSGATTNPFTQTHTYQSTGQYKYYLKATGIAGPTDSSEISVQVDNYPAPTISNTQLINPATGEVDVDTAFLLTLSATVNDDGQTAGVQDTVYQWYVKSPSEDSFTPLSGATTNPYNAQSSLSVAGQYLYRLHATGIGGTTVGNSVTLTANTVIPPPTIDTFSVSPTDLRVGESITVSATGTNVNYFVWEYKLNSVSGWTTIIGSTQQINQAGTYTVRVTAYGIDGQIVQESTTITAGTPPTITIIYPTTGMTYAANEAIPVKAVITGTYSSAVWNWGDSDATGNIYNLTTSVVYKTKGYKTMSIVANNSYGTTTSAVTIEISGYVSLRPTVTQTVSPMDDSGLWNMTKYIQPDQETQKPDIYGFFKNILGVYTDLIGGLFFVILFGVPYMVLWIYQRNLILPSIIGIIFGAWMLIAMPAAYVLPAIGILALSIAGGIYSIWHR